MRVPEPAEGFLVRLDKVGGRLEEMARVHPPPAALTDPDQPSGERWDWGQVWAHLAEFVPYWMQKIDGALQLDPSQPPPSFGRTKADPDRIAAIERDRRSPPEELMERVKGRLRELRVLLGDMSTGDWERRVVHPTLGAMDMERVFDEFLVGHIESHAAQLEGLLRQAAPGGS